MSDFPKFCPECGAPLSEEIKFCPECGANLFIENVEPLEIAEQEIATDTAEIMAEDDNSENVMPIIAENTEPVIVENVTKDKADKSSNKQEQKKPNTTLGVVMILLVVIALVVAILYKMDFIHFGNNTGDNTDTPVAVEDTVSETETETESESETQTETTTAKPTETTTAAPATVDPLSFMGKSVDELIEMYSDEFERYSLEGAYFAQFYEKDGSFAPYTFIFWSDPGFEPYARVAGYSTGVKGTEFYEGLKIGDSLDTFIQKTGATDVEIYYDQEWAEYMAINIPLKYGFTVDLTLSDRNGTEIIGVKVISSY